MMLCIDEVLNAAIMTSTPYLIVEGIDDVAIYESIAKTIGKTIEVTAVETLAESHSSSNDVPYQEGGEGVKRAIDDLNALPSSVHLAKEYVLGIIDRDVREYRNELPVEQCLFVLRMYSIESHFVCEKVFNLLLDAATTTGPEYIGEQIRKQLLAQLEDELLDFYYFSLEALKLAVDSTYESDFKYSFGGEARKREPLRQRVLAKTGHLNQFASQYSFDRNLVSLQKITKGKWLYEGFCRTVHEIITNLPKYCGQLDAVRCQFCNAGKHEKCLYGVKDGVSHKALAAIGLTFVTTPNLNYVRDRIALLNASA